VMNGHAWSSAAGSGGGSGLWPGSALIAINLTRSRRRRGAG
jgi:hypothetical protein